MNFEVECPSCRATMQCECYPEDMPGEGGRIWECDCGADVRITSRVEFTAELVGETDR